MFRALAAVYNNEFILNYLDRSTEGPHYSNVDTWEWTRGVFSLCYITIVNSLCTHSDIVMQLIIIDFRVVSSKFLRTALRIKWMHHAYAA